MSDFLSIHVDAIIVVFGIHNEATPFTPSGRYVRSIVFIQIFAEVSFKMENDVGQSCLSFGVLYVFNRIYSSFFLIAIFFFV